jgi:hypothetical protein
MKKFLPRRGGIWCWTEMYCRSLLPPAGEMLVLHFPINQLPVHISEIPGRHEAQNPADFSFTGHGDCQDRVPGLTARLSARIE